MPKTKLLASSVFLCVSLGFVAHAADYFPLQTGNVWVYKQTSGNILQDARTIEVGKTATFGGHDYFSVSFFGRSVWLRNADDGKLYAFDTVSNTETLWIDFTASDGRTFSTGIEPCSKAAAIDPKATHYRGPFGEFNNVLTVVYQPANCADAGFQTDVFLSYIGLVQHTEETIAGPLTFDLVFSRTGVTEVSDTAVSFALALDANSYPFASKTITYAITRMTLRNNTAAALKLTFPSGQDFDLVVRNDKGDMLYRWSDGRAFTQAIRNIELAPGEAKTFVVQMPVNFPVGRYTAEANLATANPREYVASVAFAVTEK